MQRNKKDTTFICNVKVMHSELFVSYLFFSIETQKFLRIWKSITNPGDSYRKVIYRASLSRGSRKEPVIPNKLINPTNRCKLSHTIDTKSLINSL